MRVCELIHELQKWSPRDEVVCTRHIEGIGASEVFSIVDISGAAGGAIDGSDSAVCINFLDTSSDDDETVYGRVIDEDA